ncbi:MAG: NUDIX domain-containing protein [Acholeplasmatales bacterium]|nr:NUDIX domain-containing protein [Acholeplasmatales bacterium]
MKYCYGCGEKLIEKNLKNEGLIPFCPKCNTYRFPIFSAAISAVIVNKDKTKTLLIKQYGTGKNRLVAGYINKGESAEEALLREMSEEIGVKPIFYKLQKTIYYEKSNTLMINFYVVLEDENITPNYEIDEYQWYNIEDGLEGLKEALIAKKFYEYFLENNYK